MKLIYHLLDTDGKNIKPSSFGTAINDMVKNKTIQVACPYITLSYFKNNIVNNCKNWELLTDVYDLVKSQQGHSKEIEKFLKENHTKIKHQDGLHAKIIIAEDVALLGSANFTESGIYKNNEMSLVINDIEKINELKEWYKRSWQYAEEITEDISINVNKVIKDDPQNIKIKGLKKNILLSSSPKEIETTYVQSNIKSITNSHIQNDAKNIEIDIEDEQELIKCLKKRKKWNDKKYIESYLDLAQHIIEKFDIIKKMKGYLFRLERENTISLLR
jgi:hypothetical protein